MFKLKGTKFKLLNFLKFARVTLDVGEIFFLNSRFEFKRKEYI
jgi:hypothetical protein